MTLGWLKEARDKLNSPARDAFAALCLQTAQRQVRLLSKSMAEAVPEQYGNLWDVAADTESAANDAGFTPLQAFLAAYSLVSDDRLDYSQANLRRHMELSQQDWTRRLGRPYPSPEGRRAYGVNGYVFSSPLDIFFDEQTVNRLLDRVEKGGGA